MMKHCLSFALLIVCALSLWAQPVRELNRLPTSALLPGSQAYAFSNPQGVLLLFQTGKGAEVLHLDEDMQLIKRFALTDLPPSSEVKQLGFTYRQGQLSIVYRAYESDEIQVLQVQTDSERSELFRMDMSELFAGSTQWANFTYQGALHMIRLTRGGDQIRLCRFEGGRNFHAEVFDLTTLRLNYEIQEQVVRIDSSNRHQLGQTYLPAKIYLEGNQLYFTLDQEGKTTVAQIDLDRQHKQEYHLPYPTGQGRSNSLLAGMNLYQLSATADSLYLCIQDLRSQQALATYAYGPGDQLDLRSGPVLWREGKQQTPQDQTLSSLLTRWGDAPALALALQQPAEDLVELSLGAVWTQRNHGLTGVVIDEQVSSLAFPCLLDLRTLGPAGPQTPALVSKDLSLDRLRRGGLPVQFAIGGQRYYGYYDAATGEYVIGR
jgi:hypothetical protein